MIRRTAILWTNVAIWTVDFFLAGVVGQERFAAEDDFECLFQVGTSADQRSAVLKHLAQEIEDRDASNGVNFFQFDASKITSGRPTSFTAPLGGELSKTQAAKARVNVSESEPPESKTLKLGALEVISTRSVKRIPMNKTLASEGVNSTPTKAEADWSGSLPLQAVRKAVNVTPEMELANMSMIFAQVGSAKAMEVARTNATTMPQATDIDTKLVAVLPEADAMSSSMRWMCSSKLLCGSVLMLSIGAWLVTKALQSRRGGNSPIRQRVEHLRAATGTEIQSMFAIQKRDSNCALELSPGILMRVQGRVVSKPDEVLAAPLSNRRCTIYSASVSHNRDDGVHQPPMAFHSAGRDFAIQLLDEPSICLGVHSHDVALFDMVDGRYACEKTFADAPTSWRNFMMSHLVPGIDVLNFAAKHVDLGTDASLEFRECALSTGAIVTCIGEIVRDRTGGMWLYPWRPPAGDRSLSKMSWLRTPWSGHVPQGASSISKSAAKDPAVGRVMLSDDPSLVGNAATGAASWAQSGGTCWQRNKEPVPVTITNGIRGDQGLEAQAPSSMDAQ